MALAILDGMDVCGIYRIRNIINGGIYIGSTVNVAARIRKHLSFLRRGLHPNAHLQAAFTLYGEDAFVADVVETCDRGQLLVREQFYLDGLKPNYNICQVAGNTLGYKHTPESRAKMAVVNKGNQRHLGKKHSEQTKRLIGELASQRRHTDEAKAKIAKGGMGNKSHTGRTLPPDHVAKVAAASLRMWNGDDKEQRRQAAADRARARWADPVWKAQQAAKIKAGKAASKAWPTTTTTAG